MDKLFRIDTLAATPNPHQVVYQALHQCYSPEFVCNEKIPSEEKCGEIIVSRLLAGDRGHYSPLETASLTLGCGYFPHSLVQQITRHRHLSFSVQSFRYTGQQVVEVALGKRDVEEVIYLRPEGEYSDRQGKRYEYTKDTRDLHKRYCLRAVHEYVHALEIGLSEEHARGLLPFDYRQHFVMGCNARSLMHLLDLRWRRDAQQEIQWFSELLFERFSEWMPAIASWYKTNRAHKGRLAP